MNYFKSLIINSVLFGIINGSLKIYKEFNPLFEILLFALTIVTHVGIILGKINNNIFTNLISIVLFFSFYLASIRINDGSYNYINHNVRIMPVNKILNSNIKFKWNNDYTYKVYYTMNNNPKELKSLSIPINNCFVTNSLRLKQNKLIYYSYNIKNLDKYEKIKIDDYIDYLFNKPKEINNTKPIKPYNNKIVEYNKESRFYTDINFLGKNLTRSLIPFIYTLYHSYNFKMFSYINWILMYYFYLLSSFFINDKYNFNLNKSYLIIYLIKLSLIYSLFKIGSFYGIIGFKLNNIFLIILATYFFNEELNKWLNLYNYNFNSNYNRLIFRLLIYILVLVYLINEINIFKLLNLPEIFNSNSLNKLLCMISLVVTIITSIISFFILNKLDKYIPFLLAGVLVSIVVFLINNSK
jgi:hypothetical protein